MNHKDETKTRLIAFRVTEAEWVAVESKADGAAEQVNEWARKLVLAEAGRREFLSRNEMFLFEELARVRYLVGTGLTLLAAGELKSDVWERAKSEAEAQAAQIARLLIATYGGHWFLSPGEGGD